MKCPACKKEKPDSEYHKNKRNPRGISSNCKECRSLLRRGKRQEKYNPKRHQKYKYVKKPLQLKAGNTVRELVRMGILIKPKLCEKCGGEANQKDLSGHHFNGYEKAMDVVWLCRLCHADAHRKK